MTCLKIVYLYMRSTCAVFSRGATRSLNTEVRGLFETQWNIQDGACCENGWWLKLVNYFRKKFHQIFDQALTESNASESNVLCNNLKSLSSYRGILHIKFWFLVFKIIWGFLTSFSSLSQNLPVQSYIHPLVSCFKEVKEKVYHVCFILPCCFETS